MVPGEGVEPSHPRGRQILSLLRLPFRHPGSSKQAGIISYTGFGVKPQINFFAKKRLPPWKDGNRHMIPALTAGGQMYATLVAGMGRFHPGL